MQMRDLSRREMVIGALILAALVLMAFAAVTPRTPSSVSSVSISTSTTTTASSSGSTPSSTSNVSPPAPISPPELSYTFNVPGTLYEAGGTQDTTSPYWWVDSGAELIIANGVGTTIEGSLPTDDEWRILYAKNNPQDTDDGYHPQNIFRLVTKPVWTNYIEQAYFKIDANNLSASPNRNESNGLLLFNRYQNAFNLYYAGIRVDGTDVIKKKINGTYYTMAQNQIFPGTYDPVKAPNLIPIDTWIGIRTEVTNLPSGATNIKLYLDIGETGHWILAAQATDDGTQYGGPPIAGPAHLGIRTDFMDVEFSNYKAVAE